MSITTKTGNEGMTSLIGGKRVLKCDDRVEAYGTVDELSSFIGVLHDVLSEEETKAFLMEVQKNLLTVEAVLASEKEGSVMRLDLLAALAVEDRIGALENELPPLRSFVLPGGGISWLRTAMCAVLFAVGQKGLRCKWD